MRPSPRPPSPPRSLAGGPLSRRRRGADPAHGFRAGRFHDFRATWRCNTAACAIVACDLHGLLPGHLFATKLVGTFCGALSAFGSTCDETVLLLRTRNWERAAVNIGGNVASLCLLLALVTEW